jgi:hypothetical protein
VSACVCVCLCQNTNTNNKRCVKNIYAMRSYRGCTYTSYYPYCIHIVRRAGMTRWRLRRRRRWRIHSTDSSGWRLNCRFRLNYYAKRRGAATAAVWYALCLIIIIKTIYINGIKWVRVWVSVCVYLRRIYGGVADSSRLTCPRALPHRRPAKPKQSEA